MNLYLNNRELDLIEMLVRQESEGGILAKEDSDFSGMIENLLSKIESCRPKEDYFPEFTGKVKRKLK